MYRIDEKLGQLAASPLPRLDTLLEQFSIDALAPTRETPPATTGPALLALRLTPLSAVLREHVGQVRVWLDPAAACVVRAEIDDAEGQDRTVILFSHVRADTGVGDLKLDVPRGTKVVRPLAKLEGGAGGGTGPKPGGGRDR